MKPIRNYSDGQWLLLLWGFILFFLVVGIFLSTLVLIVAVLGALGAAYTTYLYLRANDFTLPFLPSARSSSADGDDDEDRDEDEDPDDDRYEDEYVYEDEYEQEAGQAQVGSQVPVVDSFERPVQQPDAHASGIRPAGPAPLDVPPPNPATAPDLSEGDTR